MMVIMTKLGISVWDADSESKSVSDVDVVLMWSIRDSNSSPYDCKSYALAR